MENICIIGTGIRSRYYVLPALLKSKRFKIKQVISRKAEKIIKINVCNSKSVFKTQTLDKVDLREITYIYIGVPSEAIKSIIFYLIKKFKLKDITLLIDTPPINIKHIFFLRFFSKFKKVIVLEDWPYYTNHNLCMKIIENDYIGKLNQVIFFHNSYKYHSLSILRRMFKTNYFSFIYSKGFKLEFSEIKIFSKLKQISTIFDPRDYNIGRTLIIGSKGFISDYKLDSINKFNNNFLIKYKNSNEYYDGIELYKNDKIYESYLLKESYKLRTKEKNSEIQNKIKVDALDYFIKSIPQKEFQNHYDLEKGIYDYICFYFVDKIGLFIDIPLPFFKVSILGIIIKILLI